MVPQHRNSKAAPEVNSVKASENTLLPCCPISLVQKENNWKLLPHNDVPGTPLETMVLWRFLKQHYFLSSILDLSWYILLGRVNIFSAYFPSLILHMLIGVSTNNSDRQSAHNWFFVRLKSCQACIFDRLGLHDGRQIFLISLLCLAVKFRMGCQ